jgi:hypothetical protein
LLRGRGHDDAREELEVHLVDDAGIGGNCLEVAEPVLAPLEEAIALLVPVELELGVALHRRLFAVLVDLHRVIDDELDGLQRVDALRVAPHALHRVAHRGEVDDAGDAGKVLEQNAARRERDLLTRLRGGLPVRDGLDGRHVDRHAVFRAQEVLEEDLQRKRQAFRAGVLLVHRVEAVDRVGVRADLERRLAP